MNYKGYDLFDSLEDRALRTRNQAVVLANIAQDNSKGQLLSKRATALILGYFGCIPDADRNDVQQAFEVSMKQRGYSIAT
jgi:hypothetical protein